MIDPILDLQFNNKINQIEQSFIKMIYQRLGIVIHPHQSNDFKKTIASACTKFKCTPAEYLTFLEVCPENTPQFEYLIQNITIGETYFYRDKRQMELLKNKILPEIIKGKKQANDLTLRIWSAGCATGEEIYTILMILFDLLENEKKWTLQLLATDINTSALQKAIVGQYTEWSMRVIPEDLKQHYFSYKNNRYTLRDSLRDIVHFDYLNLNEDDYPSILNGTNAQDVILCRNVFIYFDLNKVGKFMERFEKSLVPGGFLILGASDPVNIKSTNLIFHHKEGMLFSRPIIDQQILLPAPIVTVPKKTQALPKAKKKNIPPLVIKKETPKLEEQDYILQLLKNAKWYELLELTLKIEKLKPSAFLLNTKAVALASIGKLKEAAAICENSLQQYATDKQIYFTYALILNELNRFIETEQALRKTIFLDHQFVLGHFQLGLLLLRNKKHTLGIKSLENALNLAKLKNESEMVEGAVDLCYGKLAEILKNELLIHMKTKVTKHADQ